MKSFEVRWYLALMAVEKYVEGERPTWQSIWADKIDLIKLKKPAQ
jgi:hypothetical protein